MSEPQYVTSHIIHQSHRLICSFENLRSIV